LRAKAKKSEGVGERLTQLRNTLSLTQINMAVKLGMTLKTYARSELNERAMDAGELEKLDELGVSINWLLTGKGDMYVFPGQQADDANRPARSSTDRELMARIMDGLVVLYREENQRLVPLDQGRMAAEIYDSLVGIQDEAEQRGGLRALLEQRRQEMRRAATDPASSKRQA
jgi:transcriptional regulator with XRE-family HTH domain